MKTRMVLLAVLAITLSACMPPKPAIHQALYDRNDAEFNRLIDAGQDVNEGWEGANGITPLHVAVGPILYNVKHNALITWTYAEPPDPLKVRKLLEHGADPNIIAGYDKATPLYRVAVNWDIRPDDKLETNDVEIIKALLEYGADPNIPGNTGRTPLGGLTERYKLRVRGSANSASDIFSGSEIKVETDEQKEARYQKLREKNYELIRNIEESIRLMIEHGADPSAGEIWGSRGLTPYEYAKKHEMDELLKVFDEGLRRKKDKGPWLAAKEKDTIEGFKAFLASNPDNYFAGDARKRKAELEREAEMKAKEDRAFRTARKKNTYGAYRNFIAFYETSEYRPEALKLMAARIPNARDSQKLACEFMSEYPEAPEHMDMKDSLSCLGPEGLRVYDLSRLIRKGTSGQILASKIKMENAKYKNFTFEEMEALKKLGLSDTVISAMMESTANAIKQEEDELKQKEMEALLAEIKETQAKLEKMKSQQARASGGGSGGSMETCAAQLAALEACAQAPGLMADVCRMAAKQKFPCD